MKRFTETLKWSDPWFRKLSPPAKLLWQWILDNCDNAGVIEPDLELAAFQIGYAMCMDTLSELGDRVSILPCGKYHVSKFIGFQYGELSKDCKAHNPVFASISKYGLIGYAKGINTLQEKEKDKDKVNEKDSRFKKPTIEEVRLCAEKSGLPESEAEKFYGHYESNGWRVGRNPMRSWQHAVGNWKKNFDENRFSSPNQNPRKTSQMTDKEILEQAL